MKRRFILGFFFGLVLSPSAHAQFYFEETFFPVYVNKNNSQVFAGGSVSGSVPTDSGWGTDFRTTLGYVYDNLWILGVSFNFYNLSTSQNATASADGINDTLQRDEVGPTVGVMLGSWRILYTYFVVAEIEGIDKHTLVDGTVSFNQDSKNTGGTGYQLAISYGVSLGAGFEIGPSLVYRNLIYKKQSLVDKVTPSNSYGEKDLVTAGVSADLSPMVTISYKY